MSAAPPSSVVAPLPQQDLEEVSISESSSQTTAQPGGAGDILARRRSCDRCLTILGYRRLWLPTLYPLPVGYNVQPGHTVGTVCDDAEAIELQHPAAPEPARASQPPATVTCGVQAEPPETEDCGVTTDQLPSSLLTTFVPEPRFHSSPESRQTSVADPRLSPTTSTADSTELCVPPLNTRALASAFPAASTEAPCPESLQLEAVPSSTPRKSDKTPRTTHAGIDATTMTTTTAAAPEHQTIGTATGPVEQMITVHHHHLFPAETASTGGVSDLPLRPMKAPVYPQVKDVFVSREVRTNVPVPIAVDTLCKFKLPSIKPRYKRVEYPIFIPRFVEVPVPDDILDDESLQQCRELAARFDELFSQRSAQQPPSTAATWSDFAEQAQRASQRVPVDADLIRARLAARISRHDGDSEKLPGLNYGRVNEMLHLAKLQVTTAQQQHKDTVMVNAANYWNSLQKSSPLETTTPPTKESIPLLEDSTSTETSHRSSIAEPSSSLASPDGSKEPLGLAAHPSALEVLAAVDTDPDFITTVDELMRENVGMGPVEAAAEVVSWELQQFQNDEAVVDLPSDTSDYFSPHAVQA